LRIIAINISYEVTDIHELETVITKRCDNSFNSFWLSHQGEEYPTLAVLVKDDLATLNYMPKEFDAGYRSVGALPDLTPGATMRFSISGSSGDDVFVRNDAVLPFSVALQAAKEFFFSKDLPKSVEWFEL
jgi:hypothetical protein